MRRLTHGRKNLALQERVHVTIFPTQLFVTVLSMKPIADEEHRAFRACEMPTSVQEQGEAEEDP